MSDADLPVILLMGATASGKTGLAMEMYARLPVDIVSVDSAMVYRGMDIGTGKPTAAELAAAPHALIDIRDPDRPYSAAMFRNDALARIAEIHARDRVPLLVGGTGLYFRALREGLARLPEASAEIRAHLRARAAHDGWPAMHGWLNRIDPLSAQRIHAHDRQRVQRALEVYLASGRVLSSWLAGRPEETTNFRFIPLVLDNPDRHMLHQRIEYRLDDMLRRGFVHEVADLRDRDLLHQDLPAMRAVGYRQIWNWLEGEGSREEMRLKILYATRQYGKRQITWFRDEPGARRYDAAASNLSDGIITDMRGYF